MEDKITFFDSTKRKTRNGFMSLLRKYSPYFSRYFDLNCSHDIEVPCVDTFDQILYFFNKYDNKWPEYQYEFKVNFKSYIALRDCELMFELNLGEFYHEKFFQELDSYNEMTNIIKIVKRCCLGFNYGRDDRIGLFFPCNVIDYEKKSYTEEDIFTLITEYFEESKGINFYSVMVDPDKLFDLFSKTKLSKKQFRHIFNRFTSCITKKSHLVALMYDSTIDEIVKKIKGINTYYKKTSNVIFEYVIDVFVNRKEEILKSNYYERCISSGLNICPINLGFGGKFFCPYDFLKRDEFSFKETNYCSSLNSYRDDYYKTVTYKKYDAKINHYGNIGDKHYNFYYSSYEYSFTGDYCLPFLTLENAFKQLDKDVKKIDFVTADKNLNITHHSYTREDNPDTVLYCNTYGNDDYMLLIKCEV